MMARIVLVTSLVLLLWSECIHAQVAAIAILIRIPSERGRKDYRRPTWSKSKSRYRIHC